MFAAVKSVVFAALFRNLPLKAVALGLAVLLWWYIGREITDRVELEDLPFRVNLEPQEGLEILGPRQWNVKVTVRGPRSEIQRIRSMAFNIRGSFQIGRIELPSDKVDIVQNVPVAAESFSLPAANLSFSDFDPDTVQVHVGRTADKRLLVLPQLTGRPQEGYMIVGAPRATPRAVTVRGPLLALRSLDSIRTRPVDVDERSGTVVERTRLVTTVSTEAGAFELISEEQDVDVTVTIQEIPAETTVPRVPVRLEIPPGFPSARFAVQAKEEARDVLVKGPKPILASLTAANIRLLAEVRPDVKDESFDKEESVDCDATLTAIITGIAREDAARLEIILDRAETVYVLTRVKK